MVLGTVTSERLLVCVSEQDRQAFEEKARKQGLALHPFGQLQERGSDEPLVRVIG